MWEQYADNHNGVCIGFNILEDLDFFATSHNVKYVDELPILNSFDPDDTMLIDLMTTKRKQFAYEEEVRVWKSPNRIFYSFKKSCLKNIAFGYKVPDDKIEHIIHILNYYNYPKMNLYQAHKFPDEQLVGYNFLNYQSKDN